MVNKVSGAMDVLSAIIIFLNMYGFMPWYLVVSASIYLIIKMIVYFGETINMIDGLVALIALFNLVYQIIWVGYVIVLYLIIKGVLVYRDKM